MSIRDQISLNELKSSIGNEDELQVGVCLGFSNSRNERKYMFGIYTGRHRVLILYEKEKGIRNEVFIKLASMKLDKKIFTNDSVIAEYSINIFELPDELFCDVYEMSIFEIKSSNPNSILQVLKHNLSVMDTLEEGDVVKFERGLYSHQALLTDLSRMIVTHRSGEPENPGNFYIASNSILGIPTEKAQVTEDFIIEVAGYRKLFKSNELYDTLHLPRPKEEIVREAKRRIGEKGYSVVTKNCHHFVSECRNGTAFSPEVRDVAYGAGFFSMALLAGFAALALRSFSSSSSSNRENNRIREEQTD